MGPSDGTFTEVQGVGLSEGLEVIIGEAQAEAAGETRSPFAPTPLGGSTQKK